MVHQVCSALICGSSVQGGEIFQGGEHDHDGSILRLRPDEGSSGGNLGNHLGHAHALQRDGRPGKDGVDREEREHQGHKHHIHQDAEEQPEGFSLRKAHDDHDHNQVEAHNDHNHHHDHDQTEAHDDDDHDGHDHDQQQADHSSISPEIHHAAQQRLQNPGNRHDHKHNENKHDHEYEENKEIMSEFVALEKSLGGIHRYCLYVHGYPTHQPMHYLLVTLTIIC